MKSSFFVRMLLLSLAIASVLPSEAQLAPSQKARNAGPDVISRVTKVKGLKLAVTSQQAPSDGFCRVAFGTPCYSPQQILGASGIRRVHFFANRTRLFDFLRDFTLLFRMRSSLEALRSKTLGTFVNGCAICWRLPGTI